MTQELPLNQILQGDCVDLLNRLPERSIDLIFADPPYNLQLQGELRRPDQSRVDAVTDDWDQFSSFADYDAFTQSWLAACRRVLKDAGALWVIGSYHNIFRVGAILLDLGYWILNDVQWVKRNPMPNFRGTRFQNATETLIWARKSANQKHYTFNYQTMKLLNEGKQMPSVWEIPICSGAERIHIEGKKAHSTQKPEALLYRVILASSNPGEVVLDPFFGTGTTGAVARRLGRHWIGLEQDPGYAAVAQARIDAIPVRPLSPDLLITPSKRAAPRVPFSALLADGLLQPGDVLQSPDGRTQARLHADSDLLLPDGFKGSIHQAAAHAAGTPAYNGWEFWYHLGLDGPRSIDLLRAEYRSRHRLNEE